MAEASYKRWWHVLLISFAAATWGLAQPLYGFVITNHFFEAASAGNVLIFIVVYHGLPVAALFLLDTALTSTRVPVMAHRSYRVLLFVVVGMVTLRAAQLDGNLPLAGPAVESLPIGVAAVVVVVILIAGAVLVARFYRPLTLLFLYLSTASAILTGLFIVQAGLLGDAWGDRSLASEDGQRSSDPALDPVFLLILDGLGRDVVLNEGQIDHSRFPHFAALGADSAVFTNATSNYMNSWRSMKSFMTGTFLSEGSSFERRPDWSTSDGIMGVLADTGYLIDFRSELFRCQEDSFPVCSGDLPSTSPDVHLVARDFVVEFLPKRVAQALRDLVLAVSPGKASLAIPFDTTHRKSLSFWAAATANLSASESPGVAHFVHLLLPHQPYEFDESGSRVRSLGAAQRFDDFSAMSAAYEEQVMLVDALLGKFISRLKTEGIYDRSTIIVTGDHGPRSLGFGEKYNGFGKSSEFPEELNEIIPAVPLIIHGPHISPAVIEADVQLIDLMPTVLDILNIPSPTELPGISAFDPERPERTKVFYGLPNERKPGEILRYEYDPETRLWSKAVSGDQ